MNAEPPASIQTVTQTEQDGTADPVETPGTPPPLSVTPTEVVPLPAATDVTTPPVAVTVDASGAVDWANFTYAGVGCGTVEDVTLVDGEDSTRAPDEFARLVNVTVMEDSNVVIDFSCLVGVTGRGGTESLLLYSDAGVLLDRLDIGVYATPTVHPDGTGTIDFAELADTDPMCCPSILKRATLTITPDALILAEPVLISTEN